MKEPSKLNMLLLSNNGNGLYLTLFDEKLQYIWKMNATISVSNPFPNIGFIKVYKRFRGESKCWVYPVRIDKVLMNVRINSNAMWVQASSVDQLSDDVWNFIGDLIASQKVGRQTTQIDHSIRNPQAIQ